MTVFMKKKNVGYANENCPTLYCSISDIAAIAKSGGGMILETIGSELAEKPSL